jgi:serine/threonine protein kinase
VRVLGGRYRLVKRLAKTGRVVLWRAYDDGLGRPVLVKTLAVRHADNAVLRQGLLAEARVAAALVHPNIAKVFDFGESPMSSGHRVPFIVLELLEGRTMANLLNVGPFPANVALGVCAEVATAVAAAHARGLVHGHIRPANVILTEYGTKVVGFGKSKTNGACDLTRIRDADKRISVSRDQPSDAATSRASDVYALGLLLRSVISAPQGFPEIPKQVTALCRRCLANDPRRRPGAAEVAQTLRKASGLRLAVHLDNDYWSYLTSKGDIPTQAVSPCKERQAA